jgi:phosphopantothenoylcysteine decarboxylase / phosphopantothenate---cysteine ligase
LEVGRRSDRLKGKTVLITSGPTQEAIDDVRFLSNRSSGKMGAALARAALLMGASRVVVVTGPTSVALPLQDEIVRVRTATEMLSAALPFAAQADLVIGAAAVADYRPGSSKPGKMRSGAESLCVELVPNPDVIAALAKATHAMVVGFAAEPSSDLAIAKEKIARKGLTAIAVNDISQPGIGFDSNDNRLTLVDKEGGRRDSGVQSKLGCALWLLDALTT